MSLKALRKEESPSNETFEIHEFKHDGFVFSVSFSNDGRLLATGDRAMKRLLVLVEYELVCRGALELYYDGFVLIRG